MPDTARILLICGSTRPGSSNLVALQHVRDMRVTGLETELYDGLPAMPSFVPDLRPVPQPVDDLLAAVERADAVLFCTPEYAGGLPGALKNLLDWTVGGGELYGKPVAWLDVSHPGRGGGARKQLATVLGYVGAHVVDEACVHLALDRTAGPPRVDPSSEPVLAQAVEALVGTVDVLRRGGTVENSSEAEVRIELHTGDREDLRPMFELAEDSRVQLDSYLHLGRALVALSGDQVVGHLQLIETDDPRQVEIKSLAVIEALHGRGIGRRLVQAAVDLATTEGRAELLVSTATASVGNLRFYQRVGFRMRSIDRDAFTPETGYPQQILIDGIEIRDKIWLDMPLRMPR